ncbi:amino acid permease 8-like [Helianthus annuus]|uniref:amino acid permease 8-like n=1 Tax=Helianthus annuus TaxID=4232 RepID=UPI000B8FAB23|nr:amino acid permease 8-like [Helianthus annuus]
MVTPLEKAIEKYIDGLPDPIQDIVTGSNLTTVRQAIELSTTLTESQIRKGTLLTTSAYVMAVVIGSGVLSLAWCLAQLGWILGVLLLAAIAVTWYTSILLSDCYRSPDPITGTQNYNYMQAVKVSLGGFKYKLCGISQYVTQVGTTIGYTITSAISMAAVERSNCFHKYRHENGIDQPY